VVAGGLEELLAGRSERIGSLALGVPMSTRATPGGRAAGNANAPVLVGIPCGLGLTERIATASRAVAVRRASAPPAAPITFLRPVLPLLCRLGLYRSYLRRQRRIHTIVSLVRGPAGPLALAGVPVTRIVPLSLGETGSIAVTTVAVTALGRLVVTLHADPGRVPDLDRLERAVREGFAALVRGSG
jgi:hypothetical protein